VSRNIVRKRYVIFDVSGFSAFFSNSFGCNEIWSGAVVAKKMLGLDPQEVYIFEQTLKELTKDLFLHYFPVRTLWLRFSYFSGFGIHFSSFKV
jgi:hypothetical protein